MRSQFFLRAAALQDQRYGTMSKNEIEILRKEV